MSKQVLFEWNGQMLVGELVTLEPGVAQVDTEEDGGFIFEGNYKVEKMGIYDKLVEETPY